MKIEIGKKYRTRDGKNAIIYAVDCGGKFPIHGAICFEDGYRSHEWSSEGKSSRFSFFSRNDLVGEAEESLAIKEELRKRDWVFLAVMKNRKVEYYRPIESIYCAYNGEVLTVRDVYGVTQYKEGEARLATKKEVVEYLFGRIK